MVTSGEIDLETYLAPDHLIQADAPEIAKIAREITVGATDNRDKATAIFYWVRDHIRYCIEADRPALDVLREGRGVCVTKALLHVALLRAAGVPARLGHADYRREALLPMFPSAYIERQPEVYPLHTFAEVYLDGQWVTCDATVDREFGIDLGFPVNEFDGRQSTDTMVGSENEVRRYSSPSGPEMMRLYQASLEAVDMTHEELRRQFQLLDVYVELVRIRKRVETVEGQIVDKLLG